jgi:AcrR family transcriptional regulator
MPKIVDHDKQRVLVAEAAWRIIRKNGMEQASVRNIAEEAGISVGSMRH